MKYFKLFEGFINEASEATSMWQDESTMIDDCKKFLMSNLPFKYSDIIHACKGKFEIIGTANINKKTFIKTISFYIVY